MKQIYTTRQKIARAALVCALLCAQIGVSRATPVRGQKEIEPLQGARGVISQFATVNLSELAEHERINPPAIRRQTIHEPLLSLEEPPPRPVPAGAHVTTDATRVPQAQPELSIPSPAPTASFQALADDNTRIPPDTHGAVGPNHLMVTLNSQVRVQTRAGAAISTTSLNGFWAAFGHPNVFDPKVAYDPFANRWMFISLTDFGAATSSLLIGVSQTGDPTATWNLYDIDVDSANLVFADYPNLGFNKDWIVVTSNTHRVSDRAFVASNIYVFDKARLYAGTGNSFTLFQDNTGNSQVPAVTYDNTLSTMYVVENWNGNSGGSGFLRLSTITGSVGSETLNRGIAFPSTPNPWDTAPPGGGNFAPQLGSAQKINNGDAVVQNAVYRNGSIWCAQTIFLPAGGASTRSALQWWQLGPTGALQQRGRLDDPSGNTFYGFPSIAVNRNNDVMIGYSRFSPGQYAGGAYSVRLAADPPNTLRDSVVLKSGEAPYFKTNSGTRNKWGDYSGALIDPANDTDFWTIQQYAALPAGGADRWGTWWGQVLPSSPPAPSAAEIVLYASEAPVRVGNWQVVSDATAAGGARMHNPDQGAAKRTTALASPADYFEMSFTAQANTPYRLWMRSKAQSDFWGNDSVFIQFSGSVTSGQAPTYRIGTTSATEMNLEDCSGCGIQGWGWQDNGWGIGVLGPQIFFQTTGTQTLRVQVREDGLSIDQIVLSPTNYLNSSPGALKNDTTILPRSGGGGGNPPPVVNAVTPNTGPTSGGTAVTITGSGFQSGASVTFGGTAATNVTVTNAAQITANTPARSAGSVNVVVTNPDGQSGTLTNGFTYTQPPPPPPPPTPAPQFARVFLLVEENHSFENVINGSSMPYLNSLASRYGLAMNYFANTQPSIGNYFMLTTGQIITNDSNFSGTVSVDNIVRQLTAAGKSWKSYAESLPSVGYTGDNAYPYVKRHNPFAYFSDVLDSPAQLNRLVPFSQFAADLANNQLPHFSYIIPNQLNNAHDCPAGIPSCTDADKLVAADNWLQANIAPLLASATFQQGGLLIITFDESINSDTQHGGGHIATLVISSRTRPGFQSTTFYQHQSALRLLYQALGLSNPPAAASTAPDMTEFFDMSTSPTPVVNSVSPNTGTTAGGTSITITGSGFTTGATVMVGGVPATSVNVSSGTTITAVTPAHAAGAVDVRVTNTNGLGGTLAGGFTYVQPGGETVLLADDFNDNSLDGAKWVAGNLYSGFTDTSVAAVERNQRFEIGPLRQGISGSHYNGIKSASLFNFTGAYCYVQLVQPSAANTTADAMFTLGNSVDNYYRIFVEAGSLIVQERVNGVKATLLTIAYDPASHRFWRIRHDSSTGSVIFETAPDNAGAPGAWTQRFSKPWASSVNLGAIQFELKGGTWQVEANAPGTVIFDNLRAARP
ncbi:MAG TPA: IPT/TIG domain-containing protein [Blastocatellia bacterium]|nr:IPT/TIG domain-containing protein [Blastocatellia bacterium]